MQSGRSQRSFREPKTTSGGRGYLPMAEAQQTSGQVIHRSVQSFREQPGGITSGRGDSTQSMLLASAGLAIPPKQSFREPVALSQRSGQQSQRSQRSQRSIQQRSNSVPGLRLPEGGGGEGGGATTPGGGGAITPAGGAVGEQPLPQQGSDTLQQQQAMEAQGMMDPALFAQMMSSRSRRACERQLLHAASFYDAHCVQRASRFRNSGFRAPFASDEPERYDSPLHRRLPPPPDISREELIQFTQPLPPVGGHRQPPLPTRPTDPKDSFYFSRHVGDYAKSLNTRGNNGLNIITWGPGLGAGGG